MSNSQIIERIGKVFHTDATYVSRENFFLTHKPFKSIKYESDKVTTEQFLTEQEYFEQYFWENREKHRLIFVQGDNGSGKSHLIRWVKEMYESNGTQEEDVCLFIARLQSTLRGTLEQIISSQVFQESGLADQVKRLIDANQHLSQENLQHILLHHFAIAVKKDESGKLKSLQKKRLYDFLVSEETQALMLREGGPIDRISKKLASEIRNEQVDVTPLFLPEDFAVTREELAQFKNTDTSKRALDFVEDITERTSLSEMNEIRERRELYASYLNSLRDSVVEECTQLRGTDLKRVFLELRRELKRQNKNLVLFIEDITSFTGIDKALVDALIVEHGEVVHDSICRLTSVVGVTNSYYKNDIPDNIKDRITERLTLDEVALQTPDDIAEMASSYLNAIYLTDEEIQQWVAAGANPEQKPIATRYQQHLNWSLYQNRDGQKMTLFPFNKNSIVNFYRMHRVKTPRDFLTKVLFQYVRQYFLFSQDKFPPSIETFISRFTNETPRWVNESDEDVLSRFVPSHDFGRYSSLFRIWGDLSVKSTLINGTVYTGGLPTEAFQVFGLSPIVTGEATEEFVDDPQLFEEEQKEQEKSTPKEKTKEKEEKLKQAEMTPEQKKFQEESNMLESWLLAQGSLASRIPYRDQFISLIHDQIPWEEMGISKKMVNDLFSKSRVEIDGQLATIRSTTHTFVFQRTRETYRALQAIAAWHFLGNKSWKFPEAPQYVQNLFLFVELERERILEFVRKPQGVEEWPQERWAVAAEFYLSVFAECYQSVDELTSDRLFETLAKNKTFVPVDEKYRSPAWQKIQRLIKDTVKNHTKDHFLSLFNLVQGDPNVSLTTGVYTLRTKHLMQRIEQVKEIDFNIEALHVPAAKGNVDSWYGSANVLVWLRLEVQKVLQEEHAFARAEVAKFRSLAGDVQSRTDLELLQSELQKAVEFIRKHLLGATSDVQEQLANNDQLVDELYQVLQDFSRLEQATTDTEKWMVLSSHPVKRLATYLEAMEKLDEQIEKSINRNQAKVKRYQQELTNQGRQNQLPQAKAHLQSLEQAMSKLLEGVQQA